MSEYQVFARKYRPQTFKEVLGQDAIVSTLKNGMRKKRLAHAYLFSGSRGTGKTTLARLFAKALNCQSPTEDLEPCNLCSSCKEITAGNSMDVLEIDGASNRGIDDIRQINETVGYSTASGRYKIYIIDEVHMLTKEAFNALLKTLEEPPPKVKFLFATTEPHKMLPTILSRCQRFNLNRIPLEHIIAKLQRIVEEAGLSADEESLRLVAARAEGGLRDAESLLDQILSFHEGDHLTIETAASILGVMPQDTFFQLDQAAEEGRLAAAFEITEQLFAEGKDLTHFIEMLAEHFRHLLVVKLAGPESSLLPLSEQTRTKYTESAKRYRKEQCLDLLEYLTKVQQEIRFAPSPRIALESALLHVIRSFHRIPIEVLVRRLAELEGRPSAEPTPPSTKKEEPLPVIKKEPLPPPVKKETPAPIQVKKEPLPVPPIKKDPLPATPPQPLSKEKQGRYDTLLQFAAVELEGTIQKTPKIS